MEILVCVKRVPAPGSRINVTQDGLAVDTSNLGFTTSPHEECAVEEAVRIVEEHGGSVTVLTLGSALSEEQLRYAASVGANKFVLVETDGEHDSDAQQTAEAIRETVISLEASHGIFDLILFGNESADSSGYQVGIRVAVSLDRPMVNGIKNIDVGDTQITAHREVDNGYEVYSLKAPAVFGIKEGINLPRYPTMKGRLASKKAEISMISASASVASQQRVRLHRPEEETVETTILGNDATAAVKIADLLEDLDLI